MPFYIVLKSFMYKSFFRFSFFHPKDFATQATHSSQSYKTFAYKEKYLAVVERNIHH